MKPSSSLFSHDGLLREVSAAFSKGLADFGVSEFKQRVFSNLDCLRSGLALFVFKYPSLLQFDHALKEHGTLLGNLLRLFDLGSVPSDTQMRDRLDQIDPQVLRPAFRKIFSLLQRSKILENFKFLNRYFLISLDGTGVFSSQKVHCDQCCEKHHRTGAVTYHHQILAGALVHPDQKVVFPFAPEPIMKTDGSQKNDCERNAAKRWIKDFRREHPHLQGVILADGLYANEPFITLLKHHGLSFILVCKEADHGYLTDWVKATDAQDRLSLYEKKDDKGHECFYDYMENVPLNDAKESCRVNVVRFKETKKDKTTRWMWVTDLSLKPQDLPHFVKGARARWKVENETFNTLKNQGYEFEHNYGHGYKHLTCVFSMLMLLAFLMDQCLQKVNRSFQHALAKAGNKKVLWISMLYTIKLCQTPNFETLYYAIAEPPCFALTSVI